MKLKVFSRLARDIFEHLPQGWRSSLGELTIVRRARRHPTIVGNYTLAEVVPAEEDSPGQFRVFYGSFVALDSRDPDFDFELDLKEAMAHEAAIQAYMSTVPKTQRQSYALRENTKRLRDEPFDPLFYRFGKPEGRCSFVVGNTLFSELALSQRTIRRLAGRSLRVHVRSVTHFLRVPRGLAEPRYRRLGKDTSGIEVWGVMFGIRTPGEIGQGSSASSSSRSGMKRL